jgi:hypothetical protein
MKLFLLSLLVIGLSSPKSLSAQWWNPFGPKTVEECIAEGGKTARTETAMKFVVQECRTKFEREASSSKKAGESECIFFFDETTRRFEKLKAWPKDQVKNGLFYTPFPEKEEYVADLFRQNKSAMEQKNNDLRSTIAAEIRANGMTVWHRKKVTRQFVMSIAKEKGIIYECAR